MNWIKQPLVEPHTCAVIPGRGASMEPRGFLDTYNELPGIDPHIYISYAGCELVAQEIAWVPSEQPEQLSQRIEGLEAELLEAQEENSRLELVLEGIDAIESQGFRARRRPGKVPKKQPVEA